MAYIKCLQCSKILESKSTHDFVKCSCPNQSFLDGGGEYFRYGGIDMKQIQIIEDDTKMARIRRSGMDDELLETDISGDEIVEKLDDSLRDFK